MGKGELLEFEWDRLSIPSRAECVARVRRAVERVGAEAGLSADEVEDLDLAVTEACANAIRHGSPDPQRNVVEVRFLLGPGRVVVEVRDEGAGFEAAQTPAPVPGELREGGYGLHIMHQVVDKVELSFDGGTVVRLMKQHRPEQGTQTAAVGGCPEPRALSLR